MALNLPPSALRDSHMISALTAREGKGMGAHSLNSPEIHSMWGGGGFEVAAAVKHLSLQCSL